MNTYLTFSINSVINITMRLTPQCYKTIERAFFGIKSPTSLTRVINAPFFLLFTIVSESLRYVHTGEANCKRERFIIRLFKLKFMETEKIANGSMQQQQQEEE